MTRPARLIVDPISCDGRGLCAELLPSLITLDDWGFPIVSGGVPADLTAEAAAAVRLCPRLALRLERSGPLTLGGPRTGSQPGSVTCLA